MSDLMKGNTVFQAIELSELVMLIPDQIDLEAARQAAIPKEGYSSKFESGLSKMVLRLHRRQTLGFPTIPEPQPKPEPTVSWSALEQALYADILALVGLGDPGGALNSLERLWMLSPDTNELKQFLSQNNESLIKMYREHLGSIDRVPIPKKDRSPIRIPAHRPSVLMDILRLCDGYINIKGLIQKSPLDELATLMTISHLARSGYLDFV